MTRISLDEWGVQLAELTAHRGTCLRRKVGAVLLNKRGHVLATGYNGVASGQKHCNELGSRIVTEEHPAPWVMKGPRHYYKASAGCTILDHIHACPGAASPSGTNLEGCQAIHAEQNAMLQCRDVYEIHTACVTASPCMTCLKLLLNTSCQRIVFRELYPHPTSADLWKSANREWIQL